MTPPANPVTLQMTNKVAHTLFGYSKTELRGKNISMLLPAVIADNHNSYIRNYITTGTTYPSPGLAIL
jgi:PAS domain S-box-containing protein